jgi:hypothetical protein
VEWEGNAKRGPGQGCMQRRGALVGTSIVVVRVAKYACVHTTQSNSDAGWRERPDRWADLAMA